MHFISWFRASVHVYSTLGGWQVDRVYKELSREEWGSCVVFSGRRLSIRKNTHVVIGTPGGLEQYHLPRLFANLELLVLDEADILLSGGEQKVAWQCMDVFKSLRKQKQDDPLLLRRRNEEGEERFVVGGFRGAADQQEEEKEEDEGEGKGEEEFVDVESPSQSFSHQLILAAATLPSGGKRTIHSILRARLPRRTLFINTDHTHKTTELTTFEFVPVKDEKDKTTKLIELLQSTTLSWNGKSSSTEVKQPSGGSERMTDADAPPKVLVFAATAKSVDVAYDTLLSSAPKHPWWRVAKLHSELQFSEREKAVEEFRGGSVHVLLSTDLASRGLDIPDVSTVLHYDFPQNAAMFLHRSGRTGRAGKEGKGRLCKWSNLYGHMCVQVCVDVCKYVCACVCVCTCVHGQICMHECAQVCVCV